MFDRHQYEALEAEAYLKGEARDLADGMEKGMEMGMEKGLTASPVSATRLACRPTGLSLRSKSQILFTGFAHKRIWSHPRPLGVEAKLYSSDKKRKPPFRWLFFF